MVPLQICIHSPKESSKVYCHRRQYLCDRTIGVLYFIYIGRRPAASLSGFARGERRREEQPTTIANPWHITGRTLRRASSPAEPSPAGEQSMSTRAGSYFI